MKEDSLHLKKERCTNCSAPEGTTCENPLPNLCIHNILLNFKPTVVFFKKTPKTINIDEIIQDLCKGFDMFESSLDRNTWIINPKASIYIRKSIRYIEGNYIDFIDIANIEIDECFRRKGIFKAFLYYIESKNKSIFVENIQNNSMYLFLKRNNYKEVPQSVPPSMYRIGTASKIKSEIEDIIKGVSPESDEALIKRQANYIFHTQLK